MPVQINEVIIKAVVDSKPSPTAGGKNPVKCPPGSNSGESAMLEKILEIIKEKTER